MPPVQFWFEFASTYSYVAALRIEAVAGSRGVPFEWKPFLLGPIFRRQGWNDSPFNLYPARGRYMWRDQEILGTIGQDGSRVIGLAVSAENKERLRRETETAWELGIFGAPTCVVGAELFWGNDRMDDALDWYSAKGGGPCPST